MDGRSSWQPKFVTWSLTQIKWVNDINTIIHSSTGQQKNSNVHPVSIPRNNVKDSQRLGRTENESFNFPRSLSLCWMLWKCRGLVCCNKYHIMVEKGSKMHRQKQETSGVIIIYHHFAEDVYAICSSLDLSTHTHTHWDILIHQRFHANCRRIEYLCARRYLQTCWKISLKNLCNQNIFLWKFLSTIFTK